MTGNGDKLREDAACGDRVCLAQNSGRAAPRDRRHRPWADGSRAPGSGGARASYRNLMAENVISGWLIEPGMSSAGLPDQSPHKGAGISRPSDTPNELSLSSR
jgi:hypothetical protein